MRPDPRSVFRLLCASTALAAAGGPAAAAPRARVERTVAGYTLARSEQVALRDVRTGRYLVRESYCDGSSVRLALGVDLRSSPDVHRELVKPGRLRHLRTGRGLRLGDSPARVLRVMGRPTWQGGSRYTPGERVWSYRRLVGTRREGEIWVTLFRFRGGRLTEIDLRYGALPG